MRKPECEQAIRSLCTQWVRERREVDGGSANWHPSYYQFKNWAIGKGYGQYWNFRSTGGADYCAEMWFDNELKQSWRN